MRDIPMDQKCAGLVSGGKLCHIVEKIHVFCVPVTVQGFSAQQSAERIAVIEYPRKSARHLIDLDVCQPLGHRGDHERASLL